MPEITTQRKLFLHELGDILYVERKLADEVLPSLVKEVKDTELRAGLKKHHTETQRHVTNVEKVFRVLGEKPQAEPCIGFEGLKKEHDKLVSEATPALVDSVDAGAAARTEHYEIAAYQGLLAMARALGQRDAVPLLKDNLKDERKALREVEKVSRRLARDHAKATSGDGSTKTRAKNGRGRAAGTKRRP